MSTQSLMNILIVLPLLLIAVVGHEYSHGRVAELMGDPTARRAGRLTLNPLPHLDPFGSVLLPLLLLLTGSPILFAAAKPVPINPHNFRGGRRDLFLVGLAGPASNLAMASVVGLATAATWRILPALVVAIASEFVLINCLLAVFNLIPLPPLDGSRLVQAVLPPRWLHGYNAIEPFGIIILFIVLFFFNGFFQNVIWPAVDWLTRLFLPGVSG